MGHKKVGTKGQIVIASLKGILAKYVTESIPPGEAWDRARERAWEEMARERAARMAEQT